jgi:hypothetical protein
MSSLLGIGITGTLFRWNFLSAADANRIPRSTETDEMKAVNESAGGGGKFVESWQGHEYHAQG